MSNQTHKHELDLPPLDTQLVGRTTTFLPTVDSTNAYALQHLKDGNVYIADQQTHGRGRQGNSWNSQPGLGLWFSIALQGGPQGLTFAAALAIRDAIAPHATLKIKWPNDLLANNKKLVGMLVEHKNGWSALGIGINVLHKTSDFPQELRQKATSLAQITRKPCNRSTLLKTILQQLDIRILQLRQGKYNHLRQQWIEACDIIGRTIKRNNIEGVVTQIDDDGALIVKTTNGPQRIITGEIQLSEKC